MKRTGFFLLLILAGCHITPSDEELLRNMVVQTNYREYTNFPGYTSFTLNLDTIGLLTNRNPNDTIIVNNPNDNNIKALTGAIKSNMVSAGYTFLSKDQNPDLGIAVTIVENFNVFQQVIYSSYYSGYYGYGYGGYYGVPYVATYSYTTSFLVLNLVDLTVRDQQGRFKVIWSVLIGDLASSPDQIGLALKSVDQAFKQSSTYLHHP